MYIPNAPKVFAAFLALASAVRAAPQPIAEPEPEPGYSVSGHHTHHKGSSGSHTGTHRNGTVDPHMAQIVIGCKTVYDTDTMAKEEKRFQKMRSRFRNNGRNYNQEDPYLFPTWFHVNYADETPRGGNIRDWQIEQQMYRLNLDFWGTGFKFKYMGTKKYHDPEWFHSGVGGNMNLDRERMTARRIGDEKTLNIYIVGPSSPLYYAYAYYPSNYASWPGLDGILYSMDVLAGGAQEGSNTGKIMAHEAGHWLGLKHTFEGYSCEGPGDDVADTPAHTGPSWGCEMRPNTCASEGFDPVFNFMNYADKDYCMSQFTPGQIQRMWEQAGMYRNVV